MTRTGSKRGCHASWQGGLRRRMTGASAGEVTQEVLAGEHPHRLAVIQDQDGVGLLEQFHGGTDRLAGFHPEQRRGPLGLHPGDEGPPPRSTRDARPENSASIRSRSTTDPATSAAMTGGSARTTGSCETAYSRRMWMASASVSFGWVCTSWGSWPPLARSTSPTVWPGDASDMKP